MTMDSETRALIRKYAIKNAMDYRTAREGAVISKVLSEKPELKHSMKELALEVRSMVAEINGYGKEDLEREYGKYADEFRAAAEEKAERTAKPNISIPEAVRGAFVTRFPPEPNGYMHIGHAKPAFLERELTDKYNGKMILFFDETKKVEISPDEAFGQRDPGLVRVMHVSDFRRRDIEPRAGMQVDLDGTIATITSVNSGRVTVDLNHVLAGERLTYEIKVVEKVDSVDKKVEALAKMSNLSPDSAKVSANSAEILFGDKTEKDANYFINKSAFVTSVFRYLPEISKVQVREEYAKKDGEGSVSEKQ